MKVSKLYDKIKDSAKNNPEFDVHKLMFILTDQMEMRRKKLGLTYTELANKMGVSKAYVSKITNGYPNMSLASLVKIGYALDMKLEVGFRVIEKIHLM